MRKRILRVLCFALAFVLLFGLLPQQSLAAENEVSRIRKQIVATYRKSQIYAGYSSFHGWCATMVNWHLYILGITSTMTYNDGNMEYDYYKNQTYTTGGYRVRAYSANQYSLKESFNAITENGTQNAYNILVGFQRTNTVAGRRYGHACFVHAIIDGIVYFSESYNTALAGNYYSEGSVITCTIDEFSGYYANWATFEGVIYFGLKTYSDECTYYGTNFYGSALSGSTYYSSPCLPQTDDRSTAQGTLQAGEHVQVTGLYRNTADEYWYELSGAHKGYVPAENIRLVEFDFSDISVNKISAPYNLRQGNVFDLGGEILSRHNSIYTVRAQVSCLDDGSSRQVLVATDLVESTNYALRGSSLSNSLAFRKLPVGSYRYDLVAIVGSYYVEDGALQLQWTNVDLWSSQFQVVSSRGGVCNVTFQAQGGISDLNAVEISKGTSIGALPEAEKEGMLFAGWYTEADGGERVDENYVITENTTLYAHWSTDSEANGWFLTDGDWHYYVDGQVIPGMLESDGLTYYLGATGAPVSGWMPIDGNVYYFNAAGVMQTGWTEIDESLYFFDTVGVMQTGWLLDNGQTYLLGDDGVMKTGWVTRDDRNYYLGLNGAVQTGWTVVDGISYLFGADGALILSVSDNNGLISYMVFDRDAATDFPFADRASIIYL